MVVAFREVLRHLGEWDKKNHFYEQMHALLERLEKCLLDDLSVPQVCIDMRQSAIEVRVALIGYAAENEELQKFFSGDVPVQEIASERYPSLVQRVNGYLHLITNQMPSVNELFAQLTADTYTQSLVSLALRTSIDFEMCVIIADMLLEGKVQKSEEWVDDLGQYMKANFVFYVATLIEMGAFEVNDEQVEEYPILNNVQICAGEFGFMGVGRADDVLTKWGKSA